MTQIETEDPQANRPAKIACAYLRKWLPVLVLLRYLHLLDFQKVESFVLREDLSSLVAVQVDGEAVGTEAKLLADLRQKTTKEKLRPLQRGLKWTATTSASYWLGLGPKRKNTTLMWYVLSQLQCLQLRLPGFTLSQSARMKCAPVIDFAVIKAVLQAFSLNADQSIFNERK